MSAAPVVFPQPLSPSVPRRFPFHDVQTDAIDCFNMTNDSFFKKPTFNREIFLPSILNFQ